MLKEADLSYLTEITFKNLPLKDLKTGTVYSSVEYACMMNSLSWYRMKRHLDGEVPALKGHKFAYVEEE